MGAHRRRKATLNPVSPTGRCGTLLAMPTPQIRTKPTAIAAREQVESRRGSAADPLDEGSHGRGA